MLCATCCWLHVAQAQEQPTYSLIREGGNSTCRWGRLLDQRGGHLGYVAEPPAGLADADYRLEGVRHDFADPNGTLRSVVATDWVRTDGNGTAHIAFSSPDQVYWSLTEDDERIGPYAVNGYHSIATGSLALPELCALGRGGDFRALYSDLLERVLFPQTGQGFVCTTSQPASGLPQRSCTPRTQSEIIRLRVQTREDAVFSRNFVTPSGTEETKRLVSLSCPSFVRPGSTTPGSGSVIVHPDFVPHLRMLNATAVSANVKLQINRSFHPYGQPIEGAIVIPAAASNHDIGFAIDANVVYEGEVYGSAQLADAELPDQLTQFLSDSASRSERFLPGVLRWGGNFRTPDRIHWDVGVNVHEARRFRQYLADIQARQARGSTPAQASCTPPTTLP